MQKLNNILSPNSAYQTLRSLLYALLIASLLWIPSGTETAMASAVKEDKNTSLTCEVRRKSTLCVDSSTGMRITIPKQRNGANIEVVMGDVKNVRERRNQQQDEFEVQQVLAAIVFQNARTGEVIQGFDPAIKFEVPYTRADVQAVGNVRSLKLGFLTADGHWREFENVQIRGNKQGGWLSVELANLSAFYSSRTCSIPGQRNMMSNLFEYNQSCLPWGFISSGG